MGASLLHTNRPSIRHISPEYTAPSQGVAHSAPVTYTHAESQRREIDGLKSAMEASDRKFAAKLAALERLFLESREASEKAREALQQNRDLQMLLRKYEIRNRQMACAADATTLAASFGSSWVSDAIEGSHDDEGSGDDDDAPLTRAASLLCAADARGNNAVNFQPAAAAGSIPRRSNFEHTQPPAAAATLVAASAPLIITHEAPSPSAIPRRSNFERTQPPAAAAALVAASASLIITHEAAAQSPLSTQPAQSMLTLSTPPRPTPNGAFYVDVFGNCHHGHAAAAAELFGDATRSGRDIFARRKVGSVLPPTQQPMMMNPFRSETWLLCRSDRPIVKRLPHIIEVIQQDVCELPNINY